MKIHQTQREITQLQNQRKGTEVAEKIKYQGKKFLKSILPTKQFTKQILIQILGNIKEIPSNKDTIEEAILYHLQSQIVTEYVQQYQWRDSHIVDDDLWEKNTSIGTKNINGLNNMCRYTRAIDIAPNHKELLDKEQQQLQWENGYKQSERAIQSCKIWIEEQHESIQCEIWYSSIVGSIVSQFRRITFLQDYIMKHCDKVISKEFYHTYVQNTNTMSELLSYNKDDDNDIMQNDTKETITTFCMLTYDTLMDLYRCINMDREKDIRKNSKLCSQYIANTLLKQCIHMNAIDRCYNIQQQSYTVIQNNVQQFSTSQLVTFYFYKGSLNILKERYDEAKTSQYQALRLCHRSAVHNQRKILQLQIPLHLHRIDRCINIQLLRAGEYAFPEYVELCTAVVRGDISSYNRWYVCVYDL